MLLGQWLNPLFGPRFAPRRVALSRPVRGVWSPFSGPGNFGVQVRDMASLAPCQRPKKRIGHRIPLQTRCSALLSQGACAAFRITRAHYKHVMCHLVRWAAWAIQRCSNMQRTSEEAAHTEPAHLASTVVSCSESRVVTQPERGGLSHR